MQPIDLALVALLYADDSTEEMLSRKKCQQIIAAVVPDQEPANLLTQLETRGLVKVEGTRLRVSMKGRHAAKLLQVASPENLQGLVTSVMTQMSIEQQANESARLPGMLAKYAQELVNHAAVEAVANRQLFSAESTAVYLLTRTSKEAANSARSACNDLLFINKRLLSKQQGEGQRFTWSVSDFIVKQLQEAGVEPSMSPVEITDLLKAHVPKARRRRDDCESERIW